MSEYTEMVAGVGQTTVHNQSLTYLLLSLPGDPNLDFWVNIRNPSGLAAHLLRGEHVTLVRAPDVRQIDLQYIDDSHVRGRIDFDVPGVARGTFYFAASLRSGSEQWDFDQFVLPAYGWGTTKGPGDSWTSYRLSPREVAPFSDDVVVWTEENATCRIGEQLLDLSRISNVRLMESLLLERRGVRRVVTSEKAPYGAVRAALSAMRATKQPIDVIVTGEREVAIDHFRTWH